MTSTGDIDFMALLGKEEALCDELAPLVRDLGMFKGIHHPLIVEVPYFPAMNAVLNKRLELKRAALDKYRADKKWHSWVFMHERPFRVEALTALVEEGVMTPRQTWSLIGEAWTDSENIWQLWSEWMILWTHDTPLHSAMMTKAEIKALADMPDEIEVFRGVNRGDMSSGFSWTIDRKKAEWFARRYAEGEGRTSVVLHGTVAKSDVLAFFKNRGESEIVALPEDVDVNQIERV